MSRMPLLPAGKRRGACISRAERGDVSSLTRDCEGSGPRAHYVLNRPAAKSRALRSRFTYRRVLFAAAVFSSSS